jgi:hypothetical protein
LEIKKNLWFQFFGIFSESKNLQIQLFGNFQESKNLWFQVFKKASKNWWFS